MNTRSTRARATLVVGLWLTTLPLGVATAGSPLLAADSELFWCVYLGRGDLRCRPAQERRAQPVRGLPKRYRVASLAVAAGTGCASLTDGSVWCWSGVDRLLVARRVERLGRVREVALSRHGVCVTSSGSEAQCWGDDGNNGGWPATPTRVPGTGGAKRLRVVADHFYAEVGGRLVRWKAVDGLEPVEAKAQAVDVVLRGRRRQVRCHPEAGEGPSACRFVGAPRHPVWLGETLCTRVRRAVYCLNGLWGPGDPPAAFEAVRPSGLHIRVGYFGKAKGKGKGKPAPDPEPRAVAFAHDADGTHSYLFRDTGGLFYQRGPRQRWRLPPLKEILPIVRAERATAVAAYRGATDFVGADVYVAWLRGGEAGLAGKLAEKGARVITRYKGSGATCTLPEAKWGETVVSNHRLIRYYARRCPQLFTVEFRAWMEGVDARRRLPLVSQALMGRRDEVLAAVGWSESAPLNDRMLDILDAGRWRWLEPQLEQLSREADAQPRSLLLDVWQRLPAHTPDDIVAPIRRAAAAKVAATKYLAGGLEDWGALFEGARRHGNDALLRRASKGMRDTFGPPSPRKDGRTVETLLGLTKRGLDDEVLAWLRMVGYVVPNALYGFAELWRCDLLARALERPIQGYIYSPHMLAVACPSEVEAARPPGDIMATIALRAGASDYIDAVREAGSDRPDGEILASRLGLLGVMWVELGAPKVPGLGEALRRVLPKPETIPKL